MEKKKCIKCGKELTLGAFAHNQDTCWDCFKDIILNILVSAKLNGEEREAIVSMAKTMAGVHGEQF